MEEEEEAKKKKKQAFLREFGKDYGYPNGRKNIDEIRASEFKRLEGLVYLDHAGATLYSEPQMEAVLNDLTTNVYGNPHSQSDSSLATSGIIRSARDHVLQFCNANPHDYTCVFTSGATAALKLVGEAFPWTTDGRFMYTLHNHNSVLGIREYALQKGAGAVAVNIDASEEESIRISPLPEQRRTTITIETTTSGSSSSKACRNGNMNVYSLFAFPSECNFSGMRYPLELVNVVKKDANRLDNKRGGSWMVLIDAAKGSATQQLDLSEFPADFVVLSFYKIFGYPTGLGALVLRNAAAKLLRKAYFSGGTVSAAIADVDFVKRRGSVEQLLEDGTVSFLSIASIRRGLEIIDTLTMSAISRHTRSLAAYVVNASANLRHANGAPVFEIYGHGSKEAELCCGCWGPTIAFNLRRSDGSWFGYREVEKLASLSGIQMRTGCFCNPGACAKYLGLSHSELLSNLEAGHVCQDDHDLLNGKPTGAVRISFGYMSSFEDAEKFLSFVEESFTSSREAQPECSAIQKVPLQETTQSVAGSCLMSITIFPIKSCAGFTVDCWPLCHSGLLYDREWLLKSPSGEVLTQKKVPQMSSVHASIDLSRRRLSVVSPNCRDKLLITLQRGSDNILNEELDLYGQRFEVEVYSTNVNLWFTEAIGRPCILIRNSGTSSENCMRKNSGLTCRDTKSRLSFVNEAQLLLVSADSIKDLSDRVESRNRQSKCELQRPLHIDPSRFRPNLLISGAEPYAEDEWRKLRIGKAKFTSLGGCNRCQMINLDPYNGEPQKSMEPLATLASFRRVQGKILFGILLRFEESNEDDQGDERHSSETWIEVGQQVLLYT